MKRKTKSARQQRRHSERSEESQSRDPSAAMWPQDDGRRTTPRNDSKLVLIEAALEKHLPSPSSDPPEIHEAMRYAVLGGGKRFRPLLTLAACEAVGGGPPQAMLPAVAVEFIHCYSLVHDDLPALDNDEVRRGRPTCHRKFGEALAILAGDALLNEAFRLLGEVRPAGKAVQLIQELSDAAGTRGMIGGQVMDLELGRHSEPRRGEESQILRRPSGPSQDDGGQVTVAALDQMSQRKTGRLIQASAVMGAIAGTASPAKIKRIRRFGGALGLAFQVIDDIMDTDGYLRFMNPEDAREKARNLIEQAREDAAFFGKKGGALLGLVELLSSRNHVPVDVKN